MTVWNDRQRQWFGLIVRSSGLNFEELKNVLCLCSSLQRCCCCCYCCWFCCCCFESSLLAYVLAQAYFPFYTPRINAINTARWVHHSTDWSIMSHYNRITLHSDAAFQILLPKQTILFHINSSTEYISQFAPLSPAHKTTFPHPPLPPPTPHSHHLNLLSSPTHRYQPPTRSPSKYLQLSVVVYGLRFLFPLTSFNHTHVSYIW